MPQRNKKRMAQGVRIIAGEWRGRRLPVADVQGLRPSADRLRETVFNWLQPNIVGSMCLDLFAGSGALGFEAASRGAKKVLMLEQSAEVSKQLRANIAQLNAEVLVELIQCDTMQCLFRKGAANKLRSVELMGADQGWDIVFIDPPWQFEWQQTILDCLLPVVDQPESNEVQADQQRGGIYIKPGAYIYIECPDKQSLRIPDGFEIHREKTMGMAKAILLKRIH